MQKQVAADRTALMSGDESAAVRQRKKAQMSVVKQFDKVTEGLQSLQASMGVELERAAETGKVADSTSGTIKDTLAEHSTLGGRVAHGMGLVQKFRRRDQTDKILIAFATLVFLL